MGSAVAPTVSNHETNSTFTFTTIIQHLTQYLLDLLPSVLHVSSPSLNFVILVFKRYWQN